MRYFTEQSLIRLSTVISTLLVGMTFALTTSVAAAAVVKHVNIDNNKDVVEAAAVKAPAASKAEVQAVKPEAVKIEAVKPEVKSNARVNPFFFNRVFFNPFFNEELD